VRYAVLTGADPPLVAANLMSHWRVGDVPLAEPYYIESCLNPEGNLGLRFTPSGWMNLGREEARGCRMLNKKEIII
jgi:hypothetical protein